MTQQEKEESLRKRVKSMSLKNNFVYFCIYLFGVNVID